MSRMLQVVYEDNHLLVVNKPAGVIVQGANEEQESLTEIAKEFLKRKYQKPGNVYLGVVSRLDSPVTGLVPLARTSKAAERLSAQFRDSTVRKTYFAVLDGPAPRENELRDYLLHDDAAQRVVIAGPNRLGAKEAILRITARRELPQRRTLVAIELITGRKHQIRVQFAARNAPIVGDQKYGSPSPFVRNGIALHARRLELDHPTTKERLTFEIPPPDSWRVLGSDLEFAS